MASYLAEIARTPLLTADEERGLAAAIRRGRRAAVASVPAGDGEAKLRVAEAMRAGVEARQRLVTANLGWVVRLARRATGPGLAVDDLLQAGAIGLWEAAERFDPDRGRFTTWATFFVREEIGRALEDGGPGLRVRLEVRREAAQARAAQEQLAELLHRAPTAEEIAATTGLTAAAVRRVLSLRPRPASLDDDDTLPAELVLEDPRVKVEQEVLARARATAARRLLGELPARQAEVVRLRFGLDDGTERNRAEVGRMLSLSRERVRQIEEAALERLRSLAAGAGLLELIG